MTTTQAQPLAIPSFDKIKMEERKRSLALDADDLAPSRKRLVKDESGQAMRMDAEKEKDVEVRRHQVKILEQYCLDTDDSCHTELPERRAPATNEGI